MVIHLVGLKPNSENAEVYGVHFKLQKVRRGLPHKCKCSSDKCKKMGIFCTNLFSLF